MLIEDIADRFEMVKMSGSGFQARCPAHNDRTPSLVVKFGLTGFIVKCVVGCSFFQVVEAAGLRPLDFKYDVGPAASSPVVHSRARRVMQEMVYWKRRPLMTFEEIVDVALEPDVRTLVGVGARYPEIMYASWRVASKMWVIAMDGPVFELLHWGERYRDDWSVEKQVVGRVLWDTQRRYGFDG